ncbi:hypothetical protein DFH06DRAFT_1306669 [Mycena polygramma]|nr:hypothetical protein DFH06DRAFT_1306669 [Mycena polygramma]
MHLSLGIAAFIATTAVSVSSLSLDLAPVRLKIGDAEKMLADNVFPQRASAPVGELFACEAPCFNDLSPCINVTIEEGVCQGLSSLHNSTRSWRPPKNWLCYMFTSPNCRNDSNVEVGLYPGDGRVTDGFTSVLSFMCHYLEGLASIPTYTTTCWDGVSTPTSSDSASASSTPTGDSGSNSDRAVDSAASATPIVSAAITTTLTTTVASLTTTITASATSTPTITVTFTNTNT